MDQDATWYKGRPRPRPHCVTCGRSSPSQKGHSPPIFGPMFIVAERLSISATAERLFDNVLKHLLCSICCTMSRVVAVL